MGFDMLVWSCGEGCRDFQMSKDRNVKSLQKRLELGWRISQRCEAALRNLSRDVGVDLLSVGIQRSASRVGTGED